MDNNVEKKIALLEIAVHLIISDRILFSGPLGNSDAEEMVKFGKEWITQLKKEFSWKINISKR